MPGVTVTNLGAVAGIDAETDAELRDACKAKLGSLSVRGPRGAYEYAVRVATRLDGSPVNVNRLSVSSSSSTGIVNVYVASPSGAPLADDILRVGESIEAVARPEAVTVNVLAATSVAVVRDLTVWAKRLDGVSADDIKAMVEQALLAELVTYPIGGYKKPPSDQGYLYGDFIAGVAKAAHASIFDIDGSGADVALGPGEVADLESTVTVRLVEAA